jgi:hypothetical protein
MASSLQAPVPVNSLPPLPFTSYTLLFYDVVILIVLPWGKESDLFTYRMDNEKQNRSEQKNAISILVV